jgi:hypothetical protein
MTTRRTRGLNQKAQALTTTGLVLLGKISQRSLSRAGGGFFAQISRNDENGLGRKG